MVSYLSLRVVVVVFLIPILVSLIIHKAPFLHHSMALSAARTLNQNANFMGRHAVVVGGTAGIGKGIAVRLAQANFTVTIVGRNAEQGSQVIEEMKRYSPNNVHDFFKCDAGLIRNVRSFAKTYSETHSSLDVLVQTQGIATTQGRTETDEGIDVKLSLHYYGRMALIQSLLPLLRASPSGRVLSVFSAGVHGPYEDYKKDPELKNNYTLSNAAIAPGLYNDLTLDSFARQPENKNISFIHSAPGFVNTNWGTELNWFLRGLVRAIQPLATSIEDCAEFMCLPLLSSDETQLEKNGQVILMSPKGEPAKKTKLHTDEAREFIWDHTQEVLSRVH